MLVRSLIIATLAASFIFTLSGCACPYGSCRPSGEVDAGIAADGGTTVRQNLTDVEIAVVSIESVTDSGYILRGTVVSASPVGGTTSIAETGQSISLRPYFRTGAPESSNPGDRRLMELVATPRGGRLHCRIGLDGRGTWRIVSVK